MKIMDSIYDGMVYPAEQVTSKDPECKAASRLIEARMQELKDMLGIEAYREVEEIHDLFTIEANEINKAVFRYGFALGLGIKKESMEIFDIYGLEDCGEDCKGND